MIEYITTRYSRKCQKLILKGANCYFLETLKQSKNPKKLQFNNSPHENPQFTRTQPNYFRSSTMCYGSQRLPPFTGASTAPPADVNTAAVESLRLRLAETEARLQRARAREAELSRKLHEMKRFVSVMEILESYLKRRYLDQQQQLAHVVSQIPVTK